MDAVPLMRHDQGGRAQVKETIGVRITDVALTMIDVGAPRLDVSSSPALLWARYRAARRAVTKLLGAFALLATQHGTGTN